MVTNILGGWLQQWKKNNWQRRGKPIWPAPLWQNIAARLENLVVKVCHVEIHVPRSWDTKEHQNNQQMDQAYETEVAQVDLNWQQKGELFIARWAHDTSGHQGSDTTYRWAHDRGVDLTMDIIAQVIRECEMCCNQTGKASVVWRTMAYITLPQTRQGRHHPPDGSKQIPCPVPLNSTLS